MEKKQWNPLADIASVLGSIARLLPPLPTPPELPTSAERPTPLEQPTTPASQVTTPWSDVRDIVSTNQMVENQKRQAEQGLIVFKYE